MIINQSLRTGIFPDKLKIAKVIPIYKNSDENVFGNYRPISLLPAISKVFERVAFEQLFQYFQENKLIYVSQYGFRKDHSTESAVIELVDRLHNEIDKGETPFVVFIDLSKAFDTLDHEIMLSKLESYGITNTALSWFRNYLTNRTQYVAYDDEVSSCQYIHTGVPQGSVLGPLLFLIYMNDISKVSEIFCSILFADDTSLASPICAFSMGTHNPTNKTISDNINRELSKITEWLAANKLALNVKKTKFMMFSYSRSKLMQQHTPDIRINNQPISRVDNFDFLGIRIDEYLNWKLHLDKISGKILRIIGLLSKLKNYFPPLILKLMYNSMILPHLTFGITVWGFHCDRLFKLQKRAVRIISRAKYNAHTEPLFKAHRLLKVSDIFRLHTLKLYYIFLHGTLPVYLFSVIQPNTVTHTYNTRNRSRPLTLRSRTTAAQKRLRAYLPQCLNTTPPDVKNKLETHSMNGFSTYFKYYYINRYNVVCNIPDCYICR